MNDQTAAAKIRMGGPAMPVYRYVLSDADMADLPACFRKGCCFDAEQPPRNPRYRGEPARRP